MRIPLVVCAKNEEAALGGCLDALEAARTFAETRLPLSFETLVVLDDCTDGSEAVARARGVRTERSTGGKVEAQRRGARDAPFCVFADADITVEPDTLYALASVMLADPRARIAYPPKQPVLPLRRTLLARAIHVYNRRRGFSDGRTWFSGKLFAIRGWSIPTRDELEPRLHALPRDPFVQPHRGLRADDVFLSRVTLAAHGPSGIRETAGGLVRFRAPETLRGMYLYYRRLRLELERLDLIFPETRAVHRRWGRRRTDGRAVARAPLGERWLFRLFRLAVAGCRVTYAGERAYYRHFARTPCPWDDWTPIEETKRAIDPRA